MLFNPEDLQRMEDRDFTLTDDMCRLLWDLQDEIHGPGGDPLSRWTIQYLYVPEILSRHLAVMFLASTCNADT